MKQVFISYKSQEKRQAKEILNYLESRGIQCWMAPRNIPIGSNYAAQIPKAIRECPVFLLLLSKRAQTSQWIAKEMSLAIGGNKEILPLQLEECDLTDEYSYYLTNVQIYPVYEDRDGVLEEVEERVRQILAQPETEAPAPSELKPVAPYDGEKPYIFVSCAAKDRDRVQPMISLLQGKGFRVWMDVGQMAGDEWQSVLTDRLKNSSCMISVISESYAQSRFCHMELSYAMNQGKPVLSVFLEETPLPGGMKMQLADIQSLARYRHGSDAEFVELLSRMPILKNCQQ